MTSNTIPETITKHRGVSYNSQNNNIFSISEMYF